MQSGCLHESLKGTAAKRKKKKFRVKEGVENGNEKHF